MYSPFFKRSIGSDTAEKIVKEISQITGHDTNLISPQGVIIASTDTKRIGQKHSAADKILNQSLSELYIDPEDDSVSEKPGLNLPILVDGEITMILGITGSNEEVYKHAKLAQRITEILLSDMIRQENERDIQFIRQEFLRSWILGDGLAYGQSFIEKGRALGIDVQIPRRLALLKYVSNTSPDESLDLSQILEITKMFKVFNSDFLFMPENTYLYFIFPKMSTEKLKSKVKDLLDTLSSRTEMKFIAGLDGFEKGNNVLSVSSVQAQQALEAARIANKKIMSYEDTTIEPLLAAIPDTDKTQFLQKIFRGKAEKLMPDFMQIIESWFASEASLKEASESIFMHKNTYQYQIKRMLELSGYDLRTPYGSCLFYIALLFYRYLNSIK